MQATLRMLRPSTGWIFARYLFTVGLMRGGFQVPHDLGVGICFGESQQHRNNVRVSVPGET
jgi:hypothetical protein